MQPDYFLTQPSNPTSFARRHPIAIVLLSAWLAAAIFLAGFVLQRTNLISAAVPFIGKDSGLAACEAIAKKGTLTGAPKTSERMTPKQYKTVRDVFADSRYEDIRGNGVRLVDLVSQVQALGEDPGFEALAYVGGISAAYAGLTGGCASVGVTIPALSAN